MGQFCDKTYITVIVTNHNIGVYRLIYERLASMPLPSTETQPASTTDAGSSQHHHTHTSNTHHQNQSTPSSHQPHPLSQSFTPSSISHANGPSSTTTAHPISSNPISAPITPTSHSRERDLFPQYSPSIRGGQDRALPPMKDAPPASDEHHRRNALPPISPAQYKDGRAYLPPPTSTSVQPRESGERETAAPRRHSPGSYTSSLPHVSSSCREIKHTYPESQYSLEEPHNSYHHQQGQYRNNSSIPDRRSSIGHITTSPLSHSRIDGRMEVDEVRAGGGGVKYDSRA